MNTKESLIWAAGFFDGEGYVTIQVRGGKYQGHYLRIGVNHVNPDPLYKLQELFGGSVRVQRKKPTGNRKRRHEWTLSCKKAAKCLRRMRPYIINKTAPISIGLQLDDSMQEGTGKISDELRELRDSLKLDLQIANAID